MSNDPSLARRVTRLENDRDALYELLDSFRTEMVGRLDQHDGRLDLVDARFDQVDARFDRVDATLAEVLRRLPETD